MSRRLVAFIDESELQGKLTTGNGPLAMAYPRPNNILASWQVRMESRAAQKLGMWP